MHTQIDKCAYVRNHGHNTMRVMSAQGHTFTFSKLSVFHGGNCSFFTGTMNLL